MFASDLLKNYHWVGRKIILCFNFTDGTAARRHFHSSMWAAGARCALHNLWPTEGSVSKFLFCFTFTNKIYLVAHFSVGRSATRSKQLIFLGLRKVQTMPETSLEQGQIQELLKVGVWLSKASSAQWGLFKGRSLPGNCE